MDSGSFIAGKWFQCDRNDYFETLSDYKIVAYSFSIRFSLISFYTMNHRVPKENEVFQAFRFVFYMCVCVCLQYHTDVTMCSCVPIYHFNAHRCQTVCF